VSEAQTCVTHGAHPDVSFVPIVQIGWAHVPLPELLALVLELLVLVLELVVLLVLELVVLVEELAEVLVLLAEVVLLADVLELLEIIPPQGLSTGMHTLAGTPSVVLIGVQMWPSGQVSPLVQSGAQ
jgi:hypothetical protein